MDQPQLPRNPTGWYCVGLSRDLKPGHVQRFVLADRERVMFRTRSGAFGVLDAYCPHLGAHLGYGGEVRGECLRCPFHGFEYNVEGDCVSTPYGTKLPPKAKAETISSRDRNGLLLVYHSRGGAPPGWEVPTLDWENWSPLLLKRWRLRGHPQETTENSVDVGHFTELHGYTSVETLRDVQLDGPHLSAKYAMSRPAGFLGRVVRTEFDVQVYGLGYSLVEVEVPQYGLQMRMFVLSNPTTNDEIELRVALSLCNDFASRRIHPALGLIPRRWIAPWIARSAFRGFTHDVQQDFIIWQHKRFVQPPVLADGDGPVVKYRRWARQFYGDNGQSETNGETAPSPSSTAQREIPLA